MTIGAPMVTKGVAPHMAGHAEAVAVNATGGCPSIAHPLM
jgi:hypothetical protein